MLPSPPARISEVGASSIPWGRKSRNLSPSVVFAPRARERSLYLPLHSREFRSAQPTPLLAQSWVWAPSTAYPRFAGESLLVSFGPGSSLFPPQRSCPPQPSISSASSCVKPDLRRDFAA